MNLRDTFFLSRAGRYGSPANTNDRLPIVYGDLTDGSEGIWEAPCIDTSNQVYCFAGHEVLSVANGNSITVYDEDGNVIDGGDYTFNESNNYESEGIIATITLTASVYGDNPKITVQGKGKPTASGGGNLMENIIDVASDFIENEVGISDIVYDQTSKNKASSTFDSQSYKAAGVVRKDDPAWSTLQEMMGSFLGSIYISGDNDLHFELDIGSLNLDGEPEHISTGDMIFDSAEMQLDNIINRCPANYGYNYSDSSFKYHTDLASLEDTASSGIYGLREPKAPYQFYWCRDTTSVNTIQAIIVAKFAYPVWLIRFKSNGYKHIHWDINDVIVASIDFLYDENGAFKNQYWRIVRVSPALSSSYVELQAVDTGSFMTTAELLDGSFTLNGSVSLGSDRDLTDY